MPQNVPSPKNDLEVSLMRHLVKDGAPTTEKAPKGKLCIDYAAGALYINTGTAAAPDWKQLAEVE